jgi:hypothetical protein
MTPEVQQLRAALDGLWAVVLKKLARLIGAVADADAPLSRNGSNGVIVHQPG